MLIKKEDVIEIIFKLLTDNQARFIKTWLKNNKSRINTAKELGITVIAIDNYRNHEKVKFALEFVEKNIEKEEAKEHPTVEWTIDKYMFYLKNSEEELKKINKLVNDILNKEKLVEGDTVVLESLTIRRDKLEKNIQEYLKMTTDHQKKFGEIIDRKSVEFKSRDIIEIIKYADLRIERYQKIKKQFEWKLEQYGNIAG